MFNTHPRPVCPLFTTRPSHLKRDNSQTMELISNNKMCDVMLNVCVCLIMIVISVWDSILTFIWCVSPCVYVRKLQKIIGYVKWLSRHVMFFPLNGGHIHVALGCSIRKVSKDIKHCRSKCLKISYFKHVEYPTIFRIICITLYNSFFFSI